MFEESVTTSFISKGLQESRAWRGNSTECLCPISTINIGSSWMSFSCCDEGQLWRGLHTYFFMSGWAALQINVGAYSIKPSNSWPTGPLIPSLWFAKYLSVFAMCSQSTPSDRDLTKQFFSTISAPFVTASNFFSARRLVTSILQKAGGQPSGLNLRRERPGGLPPCGT